MRPKDLALNIGTKENLYKLLIIEWKRNIIMIT